MALIQNDYLFIYIDIGRFVSLQKLCFYIYDLLTENIAAQKINVFSVTQYFMSRPSFTGEGLMDLAIDGKFAIDRGALQLGSPDVAPPSFTNKGRVRLRFYVSLIALDGISMFAAFVFANMARFGDPLSSAGLDLLLILYPIYLAISFNQNVFSSLIFSRWQMAAWNAVSALLVATTAVLFVTFFLQATALISRIVFSTGVLACAFFFVFARWVMHRFALRILDGDPISQLLICDGGTMGNVPQAIVVDAIALGLRPDISDPNALDQIGRLLNGNDRVIVSCAPERRAAWAAVLKGANIHGEVIVPEISAIGSLGADQFQGDPTLIVSLSPLNMRNSALKRLLDLTTSFCALICVAPLMLVVALAIRLESTGPVFFVQPRLGLGNRLFPMFKFRSMRTEFCDPRGGQSTQRFDRRVTRVGRIIRATSIDELPQLLNVFRGEMSMVGPRPHALGSLAGDKLFWEIDERYGRRHACKPGITGLAQIRGFRGATHHQSDLTDRLTADLDYLNGWSIWRDISILVATLKVVLHKNAY